LELRDAVGPVAVEHVVQLVAPQVVAQLTDLDVGLAVPLSLGRRLPGASRGCGWPT
jgi:hypothetical protein